MSKGQDKDVVKTSVSLPRELWKLAHLRALDERCDLQDVITSALEAYLLAALKATRAGERRSDKLADAVSAASRGERQTGSILLRSPKTNIKKE